MNDCRSNSPRLHLAIRGKIYLSLATSFMAKSMNRALLSVLLLEAAAGLAQVQPRGFNEVARQAEQARTSGHITEALQLYRQAVQLHSDWVDGWQALSTIYYAQERFPEASYALAHLIRAGKDADLAYAYLGLCEYEMRDYQHAFEHLGHWVAAGAPGDEHLADAASVRWAELLTKNGRFDESLYLLNKMAERYGPDSALVEIVGLAWLRIDDLPEHYPPARREQVWLAGSAYAWMAANKPDRSHAFLDKMADYYNQEPGVHLLRGSVDEVESRHADARKEFQEELKISPNSTSALVQLALLDLRLGELNEALDAATRAVALEPNKAQSHFALGQVLFASRKWADSAAEFEKMKQFAPNAAQAHRFLAQAYRQLGRETDAAREDAAFKASSSLQASYPPATSGASRAADRRMK